MKGKKWFNDGGRDFPRPGRIDWNGSVYIHLSPSSQPAEEIKTTATPNASITGCDTRQRHHQLLSAEEFNKLVCTGSYDGRAGDCRDPRPNNITLHTPTHR